MKGTMVNAVKAVGGRIDGAALRVGAKERTEAGRLPTVAAAEINLVAAFSTVPGGEAEAIKQLLTETIQQIVLRRGASPDWPQTAPAAARSPRMSGPGFAA